MIETDYAILGGGAAGLAAALRLIELGASPCLIEGGSYPSHKVCGEFFSPSSLQILQRWNISPLTIPEAHLHSVNQSLKFTFPTPAGSLSHLTFDPQLAERIEQTGGRVLTQTKVERLDPAPSDRQPHRLVLSTGDTIQAKHLLIATGRLPHATSTLPNIRYIGFKAHFEGIAPDPILSMFTFPGAYLGVVPIENGKCNIACLACCEAVNHSNDPQDYIEELIHSHPLLQRLISGGHNLFDKWMVVQVPEFGVRSTPDWPRTYFIGDAAGTIPPASGNGLTLALTSGYLAAEYALRDDPVGFKKMWKQRCSSQIFFARALHRVMMNPLAIGSGFWLANLFPCLTRQAYRLTRDEGIPR